jgi:pimeloyl-ACP methyl ester carboxylesterase
VNSETIQIGDAEIHVHIEGEGEPLLFLHSAQGFWPNHPYVSMFARTRKLIAPSHPGFGKSSLPLWMDRVDDIAHLYLDLLDYYKLDKVDVVGCSIGGWIAAELATKVPDRFRRLVLVGPVGVKTGPVDKLDIPDIFALSEDKVRALLFHNPSLGKLDYAAMSEEDLTTVVCNRETLALMSWEPYMHNPKLKH